MYMHRKLQTKFVDVKDLITLRILLSTTSWPLYSPLFAIEHVDGTRFGSYPKVAGIVLDLIQGFMIGF